MRAVVCVVLVTACGGPPAQPSFDAAPDAPPDGPPNNTLVEPPDPASAPCAGRLGFPTPPVLQAQTAEQVALVDLDGNGQLDLVYRNGPVISRARGRGDGTFDPPTTFASPGGAFDIVDFDQDGTPDIVHGLGGTFPDFQVHIALNTGNGTFVTELVPTQTSAANVAARDVDGDGVLDLIAVSTQGQVTVLRTLSVSPPAFAPAEFFDLTPSFQPIELAVEDVTGDGLPDLVAVDNQGVHMAPSAGATFGTRVTTPLANAQGLALVDVDHDGDRDVVTAISDPMVTRLAVLPNQGAGTFGAPAFHDLPGEPSTTHAIVTRDLDGDGNTDLAVARDGRGVAILLGTVTGGLAPPVTLASSAALALAFGDLDGDGFDDAVVGAQSSVATHVNTRTTAVFEARRQHAFFGPADPRGVVAMDLDDNGVLDLVEVTAGGSFVAIRLADGSGGYGPPSVISSDVNTTRFAVTDVDNDQRRDLVVEGDGLFELQVFLARGNGTLTPTPAKMVGGHDDFRIADFDGDGIRDLVLANAGVFPTYRSDVQLFPGVGNGSFGTPSILWSGIGLEGIAVGDANGDGLLDLAVAEYPFEESLALVLGTGAGAVAPPVSKAMPGRPRRHLAFRDLDGDGATDLIGYRGTSIAVVVGTRDGRFDHLRASPIQITEPRHAALADVDGDGQLDAVFTGGLFVGVARGLGDARFDSPLWFEGAALSVMPVDVDGDGRLDIVTEDGGGASLLHGRCL